MTLKDTIARLNDLDAARDAKGEFMVCRSPFYDEAGEIVEDADGEDWDVRQVVYVELHTPDRGVVRQKAVNRTPASCQEKSDAEFLASAPEMMRVINDLAEHLRASREALYTLWLHAGSVTKTNTDEWMAWMEHEVLADAKASIDEIDQALTQSPKEAA